MGLFARWLAHRERVEALRCVSQERVAEIRGTSDVECAKLRADADIEIARIAHPQPVAPPPKAGEIVLPDDLEAHVSSWGDAWAREDERGHLRKLYLEMHTGDAAQTWQKVRRAAGVAEMP